MDVLSIIDINFEDFKFCHISLSKDFYLSQVCTLCFKMTTVYPLKLLTFQKQSAQEILESITSCFMFETSAEESILTCTTCLQQLLTSYLFQNKVRQAHNLYKTIVNAKVNKNNEEGKNDFVKIEVITDAELFEVEADLKAEPSENDTSDCVENTHVELNGNNDASNVEVLDVKKENDTKKTSSKRIRGIRKIKKLSDNLSKTCQVCGAAFTKFHKLKNHIIHSHSEPRYQCEVCLKKVARPETLRRHLLTHSEEKPHVCADCGQGFIRKGQLEEHKRKHTGEKLKCAFCEKVCNSRSNFDRHMKIMHTEGDGLTVEERKRRETIRLRKYKKKYASKPKTFMCAVCGKITTDKSSLNSHMRIHDGRGFICEHCGKKFTQRGSLAAHKLIHTGEKPFACEECGRTFRTLAAFRTHQRQHTGEKPFACDICPMKFRQRHHLQYHVHSHNKPFSCTFCSKPFKTTRHLKKHQARHEQDLIKMEPEEERSS